MSKKINKLVSLKINDWENLMQKSISTDNDFNNGTEIADNKIKQIINELNFLIDNYYTFSPNPEGGKTLLFLKKMIFKYLFRYSYKQVIFNDHLRKLLSLLTDEVRSHRGNITFPERKDDSEKNEQSQLEANQLVEIHARMNALSSIQSLYNNEEGTQQPFYSQFGEDLWLYNSGLLPEKGFFIDVGASDGITFSNTYFLERKGWSGICIEPHPTSFAKLKRFRKHAVNAAVSNIRRSKFFLSALSPDLSGFETSHPKDELKKVEVISLKNLIKKEKITKIDLLSIDTEGTEIDVIESLGDKILPDFVIIEYLTQDKENEQIPEYLMSKKYRQILKTKANYIFKLEK